MAIETTYRKAKVWNRHDEDFSYMVKGNKVHIPAHKSITVSRRQALDIRGHYPGKNTITKIEIEPIYEEIEVADEFVDHKTGKTFGSREALLKHLGVDPATVQERPSPFSCPICSAAEFKTKEELIAHVGSCVKKHTPKEAAAKK